jgi:hypothetical protein
MKLEIERESLLEIQSDWLMINTDLAVEKIVDFTYHFKEFRHDEKIAEIRSVVYGKGSASERIEEIKKILE